MRMRRFFWLGMHFARFRIFGGLLFIILLATLVGLIIWAFTRLASEHHPFTPMGRAGGMPGSAWSPPSDDALNTARLRYARGELSREQYFQIVGDLTPMQRPAPSFSPAPQRPADPAMPGA
jgi:uncharacterized membrane protein